LAVVRHKIEYFEPAFVLEKLKPAVWDVSLLNAARSNGKEDVFSLKAVSSECGLDRAR
jgi:hypothetical protein